MTEFEIQMVHLRITHPAVVNTEKGALHFKSPIYLAEGLAPTNRMETVTAMQGLGVGHLIDGSAVSVEMFVEQTAWLFDVRGENPDQARYAVVNRKLRLTRFPDRL